MSPNQHALGQMWVSLRRSGVLPIGVIVLLVWAGMSLMRARADEATAADLREAARPGDIRMIASETCVFCDQARAWLTRNQIPFDECLIERDSACLAQYQAHGARGTPTMLVRGETQLGFDAERIVGVLRGRR